MVYVEETLALPEYEHQGQLRTDLEEKSEIFKALADPNRLKLLYILQDGEKCVSDLLPSFDILQPTVSIHLLMLHKVGILKVRKQGRKRFYRLSDEKVLRLVDEFYERVQSLNEG